MFLLEATLSLGYICSLWTINNKVNIWFVSNKVDYDNHPLYKHGKTGRKQSPVRLFTNISPKDIVLPKDEGYRYQHTRSVSSDHTHRLITCHCRNHYQCNLLVLLLDFAPYVRGSSGPSTSTVLNAMSAHPRYTSSTTCVTFCSL